METRWVLWKQISPCYGMVHILSPFRDFKSSLYSQNTCCPIHNPPSPKISQTQNQQTVEKGETLLIWCGEQRKVDGTIFGMRQNSCSLSLLSPNMSSSEASPTSTLGMLYRERVHSPVMILPQTLSTFYSPE